MKIFIDFKPDHTGRGNFARQFSLMFGESNIVSDPRHADIALGYSVWRTANTMPKVLRLDGIMFYEGEKYEKKKERIGRSISQSEYLIYQTEYCYKIYSEVFPYRKPYSIIPNGTIPNGVRIERRSDYQPYNIAIISQYIYNRTPSKRTPELLSLATEYAHYHKDVCFWFFGEQGALRSTKNRVKIMGCVPHIVLKKWLCRMDLSIHGAYYDWCPNSVVEAIAHGVPVICYGGSGTEEIVRDDGIVIPQHPVTLEEIKSNVIPPIDRQVVFDAIDAARRTRFDINRPDLNMINTVNKYKEAFDEARRQQGLPCEDKD